MTCILAALLFGVFTFLVGLCRGAKTAADMIAEDIEMCGMFRIKKVTHKCEVMK